MYKLTKVNRFHRKRSKTCPNFAKITIQYIVTKILWSQSPDVVFHWPFTCYQLDASWCINSCFYLLEKLVVLYQMAALLLSVAFQVKLNLSKWKLTTVINKLVNLRNTWTLANKQAVTMIGAATFSLISKKNCILKKQWHKGVLPKNQMWKYLHKSQEKICGSASHLIKFFTTKFTNLICQIYFEYITSYLDISLSFILNRRYDIYYFISTWPQAYLIRISSGSESKIQSLL